MQVRSKRIVKFVVSCLLICCISGCKNDNYLKSEFLIDLAKKSCISLSEDEQEIYEDLFNWGVVSKDDLKEINKNTNLQYVINIISRLLQCDTTYLIEKNIIDENVKLDSLINKEEANKIINDAVRLINNKTFKQSSAYVLKDNIEIIDGEYKKQEGDTITDVEFEDIFESLLIQNTFELDLDEAEIIPSSDNFETSFTNNEFILLSKKNNAFYTKGYRIAVNFSKKSMTARVSKKLENDSRAYVDLTIYNFKPSYKWDYKDGKINEAYLKIDYSATEKFGLTIGKYLSYTLDPNKADKSNLESFLKTSVKRSNEVEATIPICTIKTPINNVPELYLSIDVLIRLYANGKAEFVLYNTNQYGFEVKNNNVRLIKDVDNDIDFVLGGSAQAALGVNLNIEAAKYRLMDLELDGGIKTSLKTTVHFLEKAEELTVDESIELMNEVLKNCENIKLCGDISLNWVLNLRANTPKTILYKIGLSKTYEFLNEDNQVFHNLTHIEDGVFVKSCTVHKKTSSTKNNVSNVETNRILLERYSCVIKTNESYEIPILSLPDGYTKNDLVYSSDDNDVVIIQGNNIKALKQGNGKITIKTNDDKYKARFNVLVNNE